jgi:hypothetical protein
MDDMKRKIGDKFPFRGVMLEVAEGVRGCEGCYGLDKECSNFPCSAETILIEHQSFFDAYSALITEAERVAKLAETDEQRAACDETIDRLIAMRARMAK